MEQQFEAFWEQVQNIAGGRFDIFSRDDAMALWVDGNRDPYSVYMALVN